MSNPHLSKEPRSQQQSIIPLRKPSEWYCHACGARVTVTSTEYGHAMDCPYRPTTFQNTVSHTRSDDAIQAVE